MTGEELDEKAIFNVARTIESPEARAEYVRQACGSDAALIERVQTLLRRYEEQASFLESPPAAIDGGRTALFDQSIDEQPGTVIGPYKLLQQIGEGGMGVVFMAEQTHPVQRTVALKIIKPGMDTRQIIARFEAERQALALMDHPNIARVFDAGTTESGRPYFVMELVKGVSITQYSGEKQLPLRDRLEMFLPVCQAVQHAHQKGIIHRDLKPSNVMVALYDGRPVPKIIDFGVVKATGPKLTDRTMFTEFGSVVGTLEYMSPEQAELNQLDIDTRSDIYSLGVLLYELLTGTTPLERTWVKETALVEVLRTIREEEPPRPSIRLTTLAQQAATTVSAHGSCDPQRLSLLVRGELDWIVMKCLDKDRNLRYESTNSLAADIQRYLSDEPVHACPPSAMYRLRKFARRNKAVLTLASVVLAGLLLALTGLAATTIVVSRANDTTQQALDRERRTGYFQRVALAEREWSAGNLSRAIDLLNDCPRELRGWEWSYLQRLQGKSLLPMRHDSGVLACDISPNGREIAAVDENGYITIWDSTTGQKLRRFRGQSKAIWCVAFRPDGALLATGDRSGQVKIWDALSGGELRAWTMPGHGSYIGAIAFSPDGSRLAFAHNREDSSKVRSTIAIWNPLTGEQLLKLPDQQGHVRDIAFSPDGRLLTAAYEDKCIRIYEVLTGKTLRTLETDGESFCVEFSADGRLLGAGTGGVDWEFVGAIMIWDVATGKQVRRLPGHGAKCIAFSPDGQRLATGGTDLTVRVWELASGQEALTLRGHTDYLRTVAFTPDAHRLVSASQDRTIRIWDGTPWERGEKRGEDLVTLRGHTQGLNAVAFHPREPRLVTGASDGMVKTWDTQTGREICGLRTELAVNTVAISPDGRLMAYAGQADAWESSGSTTIVDTSTGKQLGRLGAHVGCDCIYAVAFSPDGNRLASGGGGDDFVRVSDVATGEVIRILQGRGWYVTEVAFSPDPQGRLVAAADEGLVRLWDTTTGRELDDSPLRHEAVVDGLAFSPDGQFLASGGWDGMVRIWDTETWKEARSSLPTNGSVRCLAFSPDGERLVWGTNNALVQVWHKPSGEIHTLRGHLMAVRGVAFSADGTLIGSASQDGTAKIWPVPQVESESRDP
jgi:WD40 repeat protein